MILTKYFLRVTMLSLAIGAISPSFSHAQEVADPIEPVNRVIFSFNEYADRFVLKPATQAYDYIIPDPGKQAVTNVLSNLRMPVTMANSILQGDPGNAFSAFWSFVLNSTLGIAGIFDFAGANTDLTVHQEDFGQTLGSWGMGEGFYLVLPFLGPSNGRDTAAMVVDYYSDPYNYLESDTATIGRVALTALDYRYRNLEVVDEIYETSLDPYATFRSAYIQQRRAMVANTKSNNDL